MVSEFITFSINVADDKTVFMTVSGCKYGFKKTFASSTVAYVGICRVIDSTENFNIDQDYLAMI